MRYAILVLLLLFAGVFSHTGGESTARSEESQTGLNSGWTNAQYPVSSGLHKTSDTVSSPAEASSTGGQKDHHQSSFPLSPRCEQSQRQRLSDYMAVSAVIRLSLPVSAIIFPFHYFW